MGKQIIQFTQYGGDKHMLPEILAIYSVLAVLANIAHYVSNWRTIEQSIETLEKTSRNGMARETKIAVVCPCRINRMEPQEISSFKKSLEIIESKPPVAGIYVVIEKEDDPTIIPHNRKIQVIKIDERTRKHIAGEMNTEQIYGKTQALIVGTIEALKNREIGAILYIDCDNMVNPASIDIVSKAISEHELITGYRWYTLKNIEGVLYNIVSSIAFEGMGYYRSRIVWGGFMCIRRDLIERYGIVYRWSREFADDAAVKKVFSDNNRKITFCPLCISLTPPPGRTLREFWEWGSRQLFIIKLYTPRGFKLLLLGYLLLTIAMALSVALYLYGDASIYSYIVTIGAVSHIAIGGVRGWRHYSLSRRSWSMWRNMVPEELVDKKIYIATYIALNSIKAPLILAFLLNLYRVRKIQWRGRIYCIKKKGEAGQITIEQC